MSSAPARDEPMYRMPTDRMPIDRMPRGLAVFDLDGTLIKGMTACETLAERLGRSERMRVFERAVGREPIRAARAEMSGWYGLPPAEELLATLDRATLAPSAMEGIAELHAHGIAVTIATLTWTFAAERIAARLGIDSVAGTVLGIDGAVDHFWADDKERWLRQRADEFRLPLARTAAIGDTASDLPMLRAAGLPFFVGSAPPEDLPPEAHHPEGDILRIARRFIAHLHQLDLKNTPDAAASHR